MKRVLKQGQLPGRPRVATTPPRVHKLEQRLAPEVLDQLARDYEAGIPTTELTKRYELGKGTVLRVLEERGMQLRHQPLTDAEVAEAARLYTEGWSLARIGKRFGRDHTVIYRRLLRAGVRMRTPWSAVHERP